MVRYSKMKTNHIILIVYFCLLSLKVFSDKVEDTIEMRVNISPVFSLSIDTFVSASEFKISPTDLLESSKNIIIPDASLQGEINLGHLIARKKGGEILPLISEYRVRLTAKCESNQNNVYVLIQNLDMPLVGEMSGVPFPEKAFVCSAFFNDRQGQNAGQINITKETPVIPNAKQIIYQSGESGLEYLGNVIDVYYWVSDAQDMKVMPDQRADQYKSTITYTMVEL